MKIKSFYKIIYNKLKKVYTSNSFPIFIIILGIFIRFRQYLVNRSLWIDEASLALNILEKNYIGLLQKLDYGQSAPPVFLLITKYLTNLFGTSEYILRLLPLISGVLSLYVFYKISEKVLNKKAVPIALILMSFTHFNIYYSAEFKQYSLEVLIGLLIITFAIRLYKSNYSNYNLFLFVFIGSISVWFSHASVFMLLGVGLALLLKLSYINSFSKKLKTRKYIFLIITYLVCFVSFSFHYFLIIRKSAEKHFYQFWQGYFLPFPPVSINEIKKYFELAAKFIINPLGFNHVLGIVIFFILIGEYFLWKKKDKFYFYLINFPIFILITTSMLSIYPFGVRLVLFITPIFYLIISEGIYNIFVLFSKQNKKLIPIALLLIFITLLYPAAKGGQNLINPIFKEEIRPVINYYFDNKQDSGNLYVYHGAERAFKFYIYQKDISYISGSNHRENPSLYLKELDKLKGQGKFWFLFSHVHKNEKDIFLIYLDKIGNRIDSFQRPGASIHLYNL
ncbi:MAG: glycosyltransferase family 39 protein [Halanaerobiales bacterium]|nr:glycosyltransferase family 39 protein [Halanaerobiales bacterium]